MPAASGLLHHAFNLLTQRLPPADLGTREIRGALEPFHILAGALFVKALLALAFKQHFHCFQSDHVHALHLGCPAELAGLFFQFNQVVGACVTAVLQAGQFLFAAFGLRAIVRQPASQKTHSTKQNEIARPEVYGKIQTFVQ